MKKHKESKYCGKIKHKTIAIATGDIEEDLIVVVEFELDN